MPWAALVYHAGDSNVINDVLKLAGRQYKIAKTTSKPSPDKKK
jgi:hypothetical protein